MAGCWRQPRGCPEPRAAAWGWAPPRGRAGYLHASGGAALGKQGRRAVTVKERSYPRPGSPDRATPRAAELQRAKRGGLLMDLLVKASEEWNASHPGGRNASRPKRNYEGQVQKASRPWKQDMQHIQSLTNKNESIDISANSKASIFSRTEEEAMPCSAMV